MSRSNLWQICHKKILTNRQLTQCIINMLRENRITIKQASLDLDMTVWRAHNWYYKDTGLSGLDLMKIIQTYDFIRQVVAVPKFPPVG